MPYFYGARDQDAIALRARGYSFFESRGYSGLRPDRVWREGDSLVATIGERFSGGGSSDLLDLQANFEELLARPTQDLGMLIHPAEGIRPGCTATALPGADMHSVGSPLGYDLRHGFYPHVR